MRWFRRPRRFEMVRWVGVPAVSIALLGACGVPGGGRSHPSAAGTRRADEAFLQTVHQQVPSLDGLRTDTEILRLGSAACDGFASGVSFFSLADTMAVGDGDLPTLDLGTVIKAAADTLCPKYRGRVD